MNPKISVVMPVYNGEKYLREAIESVLNQTFRDFEFIIINDGSTDSTEKVIQTFSDPRIVYFDNGGNWGLARSFNRGIQAARGEYIARMDADDVSLPERFAKQLMFLENNPSVGILGSAIKLMDENGKLTGRASRPLSHKGIKWQSLFSTPLFHPTVMARAETLKKHPFDESLHNSEDYELWGRLLFTTGVKFANLATPLLKYRVFSSSFTQNLKSDKRATSAANSIKNLEHYVSLSERDKALIARLRQEEKLPVKELFTILGIYRRAARSFGKSVFSLAPLALFLFKHFLKKRLG